MDPIRLTVPASRRPYEISIGYGLLAQLGALLADAGLAADPFVVSTPVVWKLYGPAMLEALPAARPILVPDGERFKHLQTVSRIYDALIRGEADRSSTVVAFGGGVVGDTAGFAAATYLRGVALIQVPSTLLAQVDSAVGGKVGVNHTLGKNLIGAFYPPNAVVVDPGLLRTLPRREFRAGLYEVVKYGMIASPVLFATLGDGLRAIFSREPDLLVSIVAESCRIKAHVVAADEREGGLRRILNFGHTAGHAIESVTRYRRFRHGEAIAYGMLIAAEVAVARGAMAVGDRDALGLMIMQMGPLPPLADLSLNQLLETMRRDKKVIGGKLHFVLPTGIGSTTIVDDVTEQELERAIKKIQRAGVRGQGPGIGE